MLTKIETQKNHVPCFTDSGFSCSLFYRFRIFMFLVLQIPRFHVPCFTDSAFSCSLFYRFRVFMFLVLQILRFHVPCFLVPCFLVPCSVPQFPVPCFTDSLRKTGKQDLIKYSMQALCLEWQTRSPVFYAFLMTVALSRSNKQSNCFQV